jgi:carbon-monoxide dehydrogenase medium subunit
MTTLSPFTVHSAASVEDASDLLERLGEDAVVYCGGTELLLLYKLGLAEYPNLVDIKGIEELRGIAADGAQLRIGAAMSHREIAHSPLVEEHFPALAIMERHVGNIRVRNQGTIGGNLCFADPHSDPATFLIAAGGEVTVRRGGGEPRRIAVEDLIRGPFDTALEPGELLISVHVPLPPRGSATVHRKMSFSERPAITVATQIVVEDDVVRAARIAVGSVGIRPVRAVEAEAQITGQPADVPRDRVEAAAASAARAAAPVTDANGSAEYKEHLTRVLTSRCLREAAATAARPSL